MEVKGTVIKIMPIKKGISKVTGKDWATMDFVLEIPNESNPQYPERAVLNIFGEDKILSCGLSEGANVTVQFNFNAKEYKGAYFNTLSAWKIEVEGGAEQHMNTEVYKKAQEFQDKNIKIKETKQEPQVEEDEGLPF